MKKNLFLAAAALIALASCSSENETPQADIQKALDPTPISFGTYNAQSSITRSTGGKIGAISAASDFQAEGFGVFAFYQDTYDASIAPNFMYNEKVYGTGWTYDEVKYWPNGYAKADNSGAQGSDSKTLSFFAYAPYTAYSSTSNDDGITDVSVNSNVGNPYVKYKVGSSFVDLLWGTAGSTTLSKVGESSTQSGATYSPGTTNVWLNLTKPTKDDKVKFTFIHALAKLGGTGTGNADIKIVLNPDASVENTKVTVKSVSITTSSTTGEGFYQSGKFDLVTGEWSEQGDETTWSLTVNQSSTDKDEIASSIKEPTTSVTDYDGLVEGVTTTAKSIFESTEAAPLYFIPGSTPKITVSVTYIVRTKDTKLDGKFTKVEQAVSKDVTLSTIEINKAYGLLIKLGLTSVKFDVDSSAIGWEQVDGNDTNGIEIDLPKLE